MLSYGAANRARGALTWSGRAVRILCYENFRCNALSGAANRAGCAVNWHRAEGSGPCYRGLRRSPM
eukprot:6618604-Pyramimonas_sp.AAC.1